MKKLLVRLAWWILHKCGAANLEIGTHICFCSTTYNIVRIKQVKDGFTSELQIDAQEEPHFDEIKLGRWII